MVDGAAADMSGDAVSITSFQESQTHESQQAEGTRTPRRWVFAGYSDVFRV